MIVRYAPPTDAASLIKRRVRAYLDSQDDVPIRRRMICKTVVIFTWALVSYLSFLFWATETWQIVLTSISMGLAAAGIGMGVMHEANHGSYPVHPVLRRALGFSLDLLGGSSYIWRFQHNVNHHTFTNVVNADNDITIGRIARLSPAQQHRWFHRFQHLYLWPLYSLLALSWAFWADWRDYGSGAIGENKFPRPRGLEGLLFWGGKAAWVVLWVVVPLQVHSLGATAAFFVLTLLVTGFVLSIIFQLAHVVEDVAFPSYEGSPARSELGFVEHQLATTANFAPKNRLLNWYVSGLNYQVEHHLFPKVCHLHYPALAKIVRKTCSEVGLPYHDHPTFWSALASHARWLRAMGRRNEGCSVGQPADPASPIAAD